MNLAHGDIGKLTIPNALLAKHLGITEQDMLLYSEMADGFGNHAARKGQRRKTTQSTLQRVLDMMNYTGKAPWFWTVEHFDRYGSHLIDDRAVRRSTLRKYLGEICTFHSYIQSSVHFKQLVRSRYRVEINDLSNADHATHKEEEEGEGARAMTPNEIEHFFDTIWRLIDETQAKKAKGIKSGELPLYRDLALFTAIYHYGLRLHEGAGLRVSKFTEDPLNPKYGLFGIVQVQGKASKGSEKPRRSIPMTFPNTHEILGAYMKTVRPYFTAGVDPTLYQDDVRVLDYFFLSERGNPISKSTVWSRFDAIKKAAGFEDNRITPHSLRKSFATHNYMRGMRLDTLRRLLGHKHLSTTQIYLDLSDRHTRDDIRKVQATALDSALNEENDND